MTEAPSTYTVGRGKPPLHTRFQKGQSGNPSGRPGPTKLAKQRFERALYAALERSEAELERSKPDTVIAGIARRMALDAVAGRMSAVKLVLSLLEAQSGTSARMEDEAAEQLFTGAELFSLLQGKNQGNEKQWLEDLLWPEACEKPTQADDDVCEERSGETAPATAPERTEAEPPSLVQGKTQGSGEKLSEQICPVSPPPCIKMTAAAFPMKGMGTAGDRWTGDCYMPVRPKALMAAPGGR